MKNDAQKDLGRNGSTGTHKFVWQAVRRNMHKPEAVWENNKKSIWVGNSKGSRNSEKDIFFY